MITDRRAMPTHDFGNPPPDGADGEAALSELHAFAAALHDSGQDSRHGTGVESGPLVPADQLARDFAEIERASAALRKAEPALEKWADTPASSGSDEVPAAALAKPRPVWLFIGLLWLSTALVTAGAVAAIARLAG
jgi:hypothetical protein